MAVIGPENGVLEVRSWQGETLLATMRGREAHPVADTSTYLGNMGFVWLALHTETGGVEGIGAFVSKESLWLRKAVDGSLIVLHRDQEMVRGIEVIVAPSTRGDPMAPLT